MKKLKIIFLGMQGSGKSTQAQLLASKLQIPYIEMGQLLRDKSRDLDDIARKIKEALSAGKLVANRITIDTLKEKLSEPGFEKGYVLDGYPRNKQQVMHIDKDISKVFYIKVPDKEATSRLSKRGRHDDTPGLIRKRIEIYHHQTEPLLQYFKSRGLLDEVNGKRKVEEINKDLLQRISNL